MWHDATRRDATRRDTTRHDTTRSRFRAIVERRLRRGEGRARRRGEKNTRKESKRGEEEEGGGAKMIRGSRENASYRDESGTWTLVGFTCVRFYALRILESRREFDR